MKVSASAPRSWTFDDDDLQLTVLVRNTGLAPVEIVGLSFSFIYLVAQLTPADCYEGPSTPVTIQGGHQQKWIFDAKQAVFREHAARSDTFERLLSGGLPSYVATWRMMLRLRFIYWVAVITDLGNGVQVRTRPIFSLTLYMLRTVKASILEEKDQEEGGLGGPT